MMFDPWFIDRSILVDLVGCSPRMPQDSALAPLRLPPVNRAPKLTEVIGVDVRGRGRLYRMITKPISNKTRVDLPLNPF